MPLYEYECDLCGHRFEIIQKFSDPPVEKCPVCGGSVHKLPSSPAFQFKGSGWYVTDYPKKDQAAAKPDQKGESAASDQNKGGKPEKVEKSDQSSSSTSATTSPTSSGPASAGSTPPKQTD